MLKLWNGSKYFCRLLKNYIFSFFLWFVLTYSNTFCARLLYQHIYLDLQQGTVAFHDDAEGTTTVERVRVADNKADFLAPGQFAVIFNYKDVRLYLEYYLIYMYCVHFVKSFRVQSNVLYIYIYLCSDNIV